MGKLNFIRWDIGSSHQFTIINNKLAWYFDSHGVLMYTRVARRKEDRGCWRVKE